MNRSVNTLLYLWLLFATLIVAPAPVMGATVTASGQAVILDGDRVTARAGAIRLAQRTAVEQGVGTLIDSQTRVENFEALSDRIYSRATGYVTRYEVISEGISPDGSTYTVTISADVQTASIEKDLRAIGILIEQVGNPRFMALYIPETGSSAYRRSRVVRAAERAVTGVFVRKGFVVLDSIFADTVYGQIERGGRIAGAMDHLSTLARKHQADLLLVYDVHATTEAGGGNRYFGGLLVELSLRAVASATADLIAQKSGDIYIKTIRNAGQYYDNMQASNAADRLGKAVAEALIGDTLAYFQRSLQAGTRFDLHFRNFSDDEIGTIIDVAGDLPGLRNMQVRNQTSEYVHMDISYQGQKLNFQDALLRALERRGIHCALHQALGNRFLFFRDGTQNPY